jgi:hypothetical protein
MVASDDRTMATECVRRYKEGESVISKNGNSGELAVPKIRRKNVLSDFKMDGKSGMQAK